jgi:CBS domain-containing protein
MLNLKKSPEQLAARDIMRTTVITVRHDATVQELATFLIEHGISGAPVVDDAGKLVGVVSLSDIVQNTAEGGEGAIPPAPHYFLHGWDNKLDRGDWNGLQVEEEGRLVRDIMTPNVFSVNEDAPLSQIARTMVAGCIHRLLVLREDRLVGIITTMDVVRLLAEE